MGSFSEEYEELSASEQALFAEAVNRLFSDGFIWYEDKSKATLYTFLRRHLELVKAYLGMSGWILTWHEPQRIFHLTHRDGAHRKQLSNAATICLLLARLVYAEQQETSTLRLTTYPSITLGELYRRYQELPRARKRWKNQFEEALRQLQRLLLVRTLGQGSLRLSNPQQILELLPTLEIIVPAGNAQQVAERLAEYQIPSEGERDEQEEESRPA